MLSEDLNTPECSKPETVALNHSTYHDEMAEVETFQYSKRVRKRQ